jgi:branched-chain amino acid transport system permease protein
MSTRRIIGIASVLVLVVFLLTFPLFASQFLVVQIGIQSLFLGIVALSLAFLAGYGGLVSLAQMALYGASGYTMAILTVSYGLPWYVGVLVGVLLATLLAAIFALISVRTQGIYFIMITLAEAMLVYFYADQDRVFTNGHTGINGVRPPTIGPIVMSDPNTFYYATLLIALLVYLGLRYIVRAPFGLALQGIRDNAQRMQSLGFNVYAHRVASFTLAGFIAGISGILGTWYNGAISPGTIDLTRTINILVIAVLGGLSYLEGAFVGAVFFILVTTFASSYTDRFNTVIGLAFLVVALFFPDGLIGIAKKLVQLISRTVLWRGRSSGASIHTSTPVPAPGDSRSVSSDTASEGTQFIVVSAKPEEEEHQQ